MKLSIKVNSFIGIALFLAATAISTSTAHSKPHRIDKEFRLTKNGYCKEYTVFGPWKELPGHYVCFTEIKRAGDGVITVINKWGHLTDPKLGANPKDEEGFEERYDCTNNIPIHGGVRNDRGPGLHPDALAVCEHAVESGIIPASSQPKEIVTYNSPLSNNFLENNGLCIEGNYRVKSSWNISTLENERYSLNRAILCYFAVEQLDESLFYMVETNSIFRPFAKRKWLKDEYAKEIVIDCKIGTYTYAENIIYGYKDTWLKFGSISPYPEFQRSYLEGACASLMVNKNPLANIPAARPVTEIEQAAAPMQPSLNESRKPELHETLDNTPFYWRIK